MVTPSGGSRVARVSCALVAGFRDAPSRCRHLRNLIGRPLAMKLKTLVAFALVSTAAAACSSTTPTAPSRTPRDAAYDGGLGLGSGNKSDSTATNNNTASGEEAVSGGLGLGSGN